MQWYHETLLIMAMVAVILAWKVPKAALWVGFGAFSYVTSIWWHNSDFPYATLYGAATNFLTCIAMFSVGGSKWPKWEMRIFACFILMLLIDLLFACGVIETQYIFAVSLEVVNAYALLVISAAGIVERVGGGRNLSHPYRNILAYIHRAVFSEGKKQYPRWWRHP